MGDILNYLKTFCKKPVVEDNNEDIGANNKVSFRMTVMNFHTFP